MSKEQNFVIAGAGDMALDAWGLQKMVHPHSLFHSAFTFDVPLKKWNSVVNGVEENLLTSTLVTSVDGKLSVKTAANNGDVTYLHSRRHPRYQPNRGHVYSNSVIIPNPTDNAVEDFGLFTDSDGVFFRVHTDGKLYACLQSNGVLEHEDLIKFPSSFDDDPLDYSKGNVYDIQYQWRGSGNYRFFAGNPKTGRIEVIHEIKNLNRLTNLTIQNPSLPAAYRVTSLGDAGEIQSGCVDITSEGGDDRHEQYQSAKVLDKSISGTDIPVLIIYSPHLIGTKMNTIDGRLARITGSADKRTIFQAWSTRDPTAFTGAVFNSVGVGSYVEFDIAATAADINKLSFITAFRVPANDSKALDNPAKENVDFFFIHGDYIVVTATVTGGLCDAVIEWGEER